VVDQNLVGVSHKINQTAKIWLSEIKM